MTGEFCSDREFFVATDLDSDKKKTKKNPWDLGHHKRNHFIGKENINLVKKMIENMILDKKKWQKKSPLLSNEQGSQRENR